MLPKKNIDKGLVIQFFGSLIYKEKRVIYTKQKTKTDSKFQGAPRELIFTITTFSFFL